MHSETSSIYFVKIANSCFLTVQNPKNIHFMRNAVLVLLVVVLFHQSFNAIKLNYIKLSFSFGCRLMRGVASALAFMHTHGVAMLPRHATPRRTISVRAMHRKWCARSVACNTLEKLFVSFGFRSVSISHTHTHTFSQRLHLSLRRWSNCHCTTYAKFIRQS